MNFWLIVPVKPFSEGKSRLANALTAAERTQLNRQLFTHVIKSALATPLLDGIIVVSRDPTVCQSIITPRLQFVHEQGEGLNRALTQGRRAAVARGAETILVLPADLPYLTTADIDVLYQRGQQNGQSEPGIVLVPSTDNGTNALLLKPPTAIEFAFGYNSFANHCRAARLANVPYIVHHSPTLAFDLDSPPDLARIQSERFIATRGTVSTGTTAGGFAVATWDSSG